jgi:hypothetical protein
LSKPSHVPQSLFLHGCYPIANDLSLRLLDLAVLDKKIQAWEHRMKFKIKEIHTSQVKSVFVTIPDASIGACKAPPLV